MSHSRKNIDSDVIEKNSSTDSLRSSSKFATPASPVVKVKKRESQILKDPLYYHPSAHPEHATLFKQRSAELNKNLKGNGVTDPLIRDDLSSETKATL